MNKKTDTLRIALVSMKHRLGDVASNLERHALWIERGLETGAQFIGFPEFSLTGWTYDRSQALAVDSAPLKQIAAWAALHRVYIGTCFTEKSRQHLHNTSVIYGPRGRVGLMRKVNLVSSEAKHYTAGREFGVFDVAGCRVGIATCADATYSEIFRILSLRGAEVIFAPHANTLPHYGGTPGGWYRWRMERWPLFARDCGVVIAGVNNAGLFDRPTRNEHQTVFCGGGAVIDAHGKVVARARVRTPKECLIVADIDLKALRKARKKAPSREFRPDIVYDAAFNGLPTRP